MSRGRESERDRTTTNRDFRSDFRVMAFMLSIRLTRLSVVRCPNISSYRFVCSSQGSQFEDDFKASHISTSPFQRVLLTVGSSLISLKDPTRGDMIATLGEASGYYALKYMKEKMESNEEGQEILRKRPRINSRIVDLERLKKLPEGTLGKVYSNFLETNKVTPDSRPFVQFVDDVELAYVMQRYREVHDLFHAVLGMKTNMLGEVTVKWVEAIQTRLPMCIGGATFGSIRLAKKQRQRYLKYYLPWAIHTGKEANFIMNVFFEQRWDQPLQDLHSELNITPFKEGVHPWRK